MTSTATVVVHLSLVEGGGRLDSDLVELCVVVERICREEGWRGRREGERERERGGEGGGTEAKYIYSC